MEESTNNSTISNDTLKHDEKENVISDEDSLTKPKKKYIRKTPEEDKRRTKERTPKQLEALRKGREKVQQRVMKKKEEEIQKYLAEIALTKSEQNLDYNTAKENNKVSQIEQKFSDSESDALSSSSSEEEIIIKSKKKKLKKQKKKKKIIYLSDSDSGSDSDSYVIEQPKRSRVNRPQQLQNEIKQELPKIDYRSFFC